MTEFLQKRMNHFPELEEAAEQLWVENGLAIHTLQRDLIQLLATRYAVDVDIAPTEAMAGALRRYNPLTRRLELSEMLPIESRTFQLGVQIAFLGFRREIETLVGGGKFSTPEADALARAALASYFAAAVMAPYQRFLEAARSTRYDLTILRNRFALSFEQVCHRLTTLRRKGQEGLPFHLIRVDIAGNISKRFSASGIQMARFGAACPRWNVYDSFATPGILRVQVSEMPDGQRFFCVASTIRPSGRGSAGRACCRPAASSPSGSAPTSATPATSSMPTGSISTIRRSSRRSASPAASARAPTARIAPSPRCTSGWSSTRTAAA